MNRSSGNLTPGMSAMRAEASGGIRDSFSSDVSALSGSSAVSAMAPESLELVRRLPAQAKCWVRAKVFSKFTTSIFGEWRRVWAECRGGVLLMSENGEAAFTKNINDPLDDDIISFDLHGGTVEVVKLRGKGDVLSVTKKKGSRRRCMLTFEDDTQFLKWHSVFSIAVLHGDVDLSHFDVIRKVGEGGMGSVSLVSLREQPDKIFAMKSIEKAGLYEDESVFRRAMEERAVLELVDYHPFVLNLRYAFESADYIYLIIEFCHGGDLFDHLVSRGTVLDENTAMILAAQVIVGLEHLHSINAVYRDLKPENILLDDEGHIRIADFGLAKLLGDKNLARTDTVCGTREYIAPEMLIGEYGMSVDFWSLGVLLYHVLVGNPPFSSEDPEEVFDLILEGTIHFPDCLSKRSVDFLSQLLYKDPLKRIPEKDPFKYLKSHPYFEGVDWDKLLDKRISGPFEEYCRAKVYRNQEHPVGRSSLKIKRSEIYNVKNGKKIKTKNFSAISGFSYNHLALEKVSCNIPTTTKKAQSAGPPEKKTIFRRLKFPY